MSSFLPSFISRIRKTIQSRILFTGNSGPKHLGRWTLHGCPSQINTKVDWSNEDHCGPCGERKMLYTSTTPTPTPTPTTTKHQSSTSSSSS